MLRAALILALAGFAGVALAQTEGGGPRQVPAAPVQGQTTAPVPKSKPVLTLAQKEALRKLCAVPANRRDERCAAQVQLAPAVND